MTSCLFIYIIMKLEAHVENRGFYNGATLNTIQFLIPCIIATSEYAVLLEILIILYNSLKDDTFLG